MNNKTKGVIATIAAIFLCGLPGLLMGVVGTVRLFMSGGPGMTPSLLSLVPIGVSLFLMLIPVGVGFFTLRKKPALPTSDKDNPHR